MTILFETIAIYQGQIQNLYYHNQRFIQGQLFLGSDMIIDDIQSLIQIPNNTYQKLIRCRVTYHKNHIDVAYFDYMPKAIQSFKIVMCNDIDYAYKYDNRQVINSLLAQKGDCDDVMIIKNGFVSDCSIGNLLFLKDGQWYTPDTPLLRGTQRQYLLDSGVVRLASIGKEQLTDYEQVMMVNALNPFDVRRAVGVAQIFA